MAALIRCGFRIYSKNLSNSFYSLFSSPVYHGIASPMVHRLVATSIQSKDRLLNEVHHKIDYNQGISSQLFQSLLSSLEEQGPLSEQDMGLLLHICSAGPFDCPTDRRLGHVEDLWTKLEKNSISPSIKLYNIKLKAYCINKKDFNPLDELLNIKSLGLNPDKVTYSLLIEGFCLKGDINGANSVLEAMKTAQLAINVIVFNSFITGHLKAGSPEEADQVLELIRTSGLNPNAHTYFRFASHYAEEGDMDSVTKYISQAEAEDVPLDILMLLDLYRTMVTFGHSTPAGKLIQAISEKGVFSAPLMQKSCHLVSEGFVDAAMELYTMMPAVEEGKIASNSGNFLLKSMVINGYSAQELFNAAEKILEISPKALFAHRNALHLAFRAGQTDVAMEILELMVAKNHKIKVPYTVPAICSYRNQENTEGVYKATEILLNIPNSGNRDDRYDQIVNCSYPALLQCKQSREDIVARFKKYERLWNSVFFLDDLEKEGFGVALSNVEGKDIEGGIFQWSDAPRSFIKYLPQNIDSCVEALALIHQQRSVDQENFNFLSTRVVRYVVNSRDWDSLEKLVDGLLEKKLFLVRSLKQVSVLSEAPSHIREKIDKLCVGPNNYSSQQNRKSQYLSQAQLQEMSEEDLRNYVKKNPDRFLPRLILLNRAMEANDLDSMKQLLREFQALDYSLTLVPTMRVITKLTQLKDTETALVYFEELKKITGDSYKPTIPLMIGEELIKQGNVEGAIDMIIVAKKSEFGLEPRSKAIKRRMLMSMLENAPTPEDATKVHAVMFSSEPILPGNESNSLHGAYVRRICAGEDDSALVDTLMSVYQAYHVFPHHDFVLDQLIKKKDVENLKKVMDLGNMAFGSNFFHHKLAISFIRCGMPDRGATIFKTPGLKIKEKVLNSNCQYFIREKQIEALESLVTVMKDMPVSQANMLRNLVEGHVSVGNLQQATEAVQQFAEDYKNPPVSAVEFLVQAYSKRGEELPEIVKTYSSQINQSHTLQESESSSLSHLDEMAGNEPGDNSEHTDSASKS